MVSDAHGRYGEAARRGRVFFAASAAAQAVSVALNTTYTGLCLYNPPASGSNLELLSVGIALSVAPAGIATLGLIGGYIATGVVTHTAALTPGCTLLGGAVGVGKADSQATLPSTPVWLDQLGSGFTAAALYATTPSKIDIAGMWVVPPGGYIAVGALTAVTGLFSMQWEEVPIMA